MTVALPAGFRFGIFGEAGKQTIGKPGAAPSLAKAQRAEFELLFLCAEIFQGQCTCVLESSAAVKAAEREFSSKGLRPRLVPSVSKARAKAAAGFGAKAAAGERAEQQARVLVISQPSAADLKKVVKPEGGAVLLLNPRKAPGAEYEPVYHLEDNPHPDWEGGLLFRSYPEDWALGVAGFGGGVTVHGRSPTRPLLEAIDQGFVQIKNNSNPFMKTVGAAAALRRRDAVDESSDQAV